jgi:spore germination cell wall hydrolase CwlJ-like protein
MRKHIDLLNEAALEEKKIGHIAAAAALAGTMGYHIGKSQEVTEPPLPQIIITGMDDGPPIDDSEEAKPNKKLSKQDEAIRLLALTIWGEARSDGPSAMRAVAHVIMNRLESERAFGNSIKDVVWKRKHFSCWNQGDPNRKAMTLIPKLPDTHPSKQRWYEAVKIARNIIKGRDKQDPTNGALFYHTKQMGTPYWVTPDIKPVARIGGHLFYQNDAKAHDKA